jgi:hypothetical protein
MSTSTDGGHLAGTPSSRQSGDTGRIRLNSRTGSSNFKTQPNQAVTNFLA